MLYLISKIKWMLRVFNEKKPSSGKNENPLFLSKTSLLHRHKKFSTSTVFEVYIFLLQNYYLLNGDVGCSVSLMCVLKTLFYMNLMYKSVLYILNNYLAFWSLASELILWTDLFFVDSPELRFVSGTSIQKEISRLVSVLFG